jgi:hypothetical protein
VGLVFNMVYLLAMTRMVNNPQRRKQAASRRGGTFWSSRDVLIDATPQFGAEHPAPSILLKPQTPVFALQQ